MRKVYEEVEKQIKEVGIKPGELAMDRDNRYKYKLRIFSFILDKEFIFTVDDLVNCLVRNDEVRKEDVYNLEMGEVFFCIIDGYCLWNLSGRKPEVSKAHGASHIINGYGLKWSIIREEKKVMQDLDSKITCPAVVINLQDYYLVHKYEYEKVKVELKELQRQNEVLKMLLDAEEARWKDHVLENQEERD